MIDVRTYGAVPDGTTDCTSAINSAITAGDIIIQNGIFLLSESIKIPSNRTMHLKNCEIKMADASNDNFFRNSDFEGGNVNVHVIGQGNVLLNARAAYQDNAFETYGPLDPPSDTLYRYVGIVMCNVNGFSIKNINITQTMKWQVLLQKASNGIVDNIYLAHQYSGGNQDGFDIVVGCNNIDFSKIKGRSGDDFVGIFVGKETGIRVNATNWDVGDNHDLTFNNLDVYSTPYRAIILGGEATNDIYNIDFNNLRVHTCQYLLLNYNDLYTGVPTKDTVKDITLDEVTVDANTGDNVVRLLEGCSNLVLTDFTNDSGKTDLYTQEGKTFENISINGLVIPVPTVLTATVENANKDKVVITCSAAMNESYVPATTDFALAGKTITNVDVTGAVVTLTVSVAYAYGDTITVDYTKPVSNYLRDTDGAILATFADQAVTNNVAETYPEVIDDGNTVAWFDMNENITIVSDHISVWGDKSGLGNNLTQGNAASRPTLEADGVLFNGSAHVMKCATFSLAQPEFIYAVMKQVTWGVGDVFWDGNAAATRGGITPVTSTPRIGLFTSWGANIVNDNLAVDTWAIVRAKYHGANSSIQIDNTAAATGSLNAQNMDGFTLGATYALTAPANIKVKAVIIRKVADDAEDQVDIYNYLATKFGLDTI